MKNKILCGDSLEVLKDFEDNYFDSVVTDPPYGISFMSRSWDYDVPQVELWEEVYRVLKPGGHILSFAGSRTYHRMAVNIEDAGFEIRDMLGWLYGSGFPKSHNIGHKVEKYKGWGTALKPAHEPIVMARKPFNTSVAENVLTHGTGGINIDECRVGTEFVKQLTDVKSHQKWKEQDGRKEKKVKNKKIEYKEGRFPANIIHDGSEEVLEIFPETGKSSGGRIGKKKQSNTTHIVAGEYKKGNPGFGDSGSAARYFYCAKASKAERNMGLDDYEEKPMGMSNRAKHRSTLDDSHDIGLNRVINRKNYHPTVKPIKLMEYLVRLVTPKEGIVLEPFAGSGTTLIACKQQGFNYIGIEKEQEYCDIAEARLKGVQVQGELF
tara:strand:- start:641 stop:1777 length:1137 start_codon:yes stop_codon:yes gene_type:complete